MAFRILVIHPGEPSQPLAGTIEHDIVRKQGTTPNFYYCENNYDALSYVWNSNSKPCTIILDGHSIMITQSLFNALVRFRDLRTHRRIWADGICINQDDKRERGAQVALMPEIYSFAAKVLVYLGEQNDGSELVPKLIEAVVRVDNSRLREGDLGANELAVLGLPSVHDPAWRAIVKFFCRPWFSRVWVIQEVVLARSARFYCGDWELKWWQIAEMGERFDYCLRSYAFANRDLDFTSASQGASSVAMMRGFQGTRSTVADRLFDLEADIALPSPSSRTSKGLPSEIAATRSSVIRSCKEQPELFPVLERVILAMDCIKTSRTSILKLLGVFSHHEASLPRDRLFALVGLSGDVGLRDFPPDYDESERETNARFSRTLVEKGHGMDVLYHATKHPVVWETGFYPSWSPYWTLEQSVPDRHWLQLGWAYSSHPGGFGALTKPADAVSLVKGEPNLLQVRGSQLGTLRGSNCIAQISIYGIQVSNFLPRIKKFFEHVSELMSGARYFTGESWDEVQCRTLIADHGTDEGLGVREKLEEFMKLKDRLTRTTLPEDSPGLFESDWARRWFALAGRGHYAVCRTSEGYIGLVPNVTRVDDVIVMLQGSDLPFVLRATPFPGYYQFIGGCYMHGLMKGEAWKQVEKVNDMLLV